MIKTLPQFDREMLIEWLFVATGQKRRLWEKYDDDRLYAVYIVNVIENSTLD